MHKLIFTGIISFACLFYCVAASSQSRTPSIKLAAFQRIILNGVAPTPVVKVGGEEITATDAPTQSEYFLYLITSRVSNLQLSQVWINRELYTATLNRVNTRSVVLENGKYSDTLVKYTREAIWQISIQEKDASGMQPKKNMAAQVAGNELVIRLTNNKGSIYTRTLKTIPQLKPFAGM